MEKRLKKITNIIHKKLLSKALQHPKASELIKAHPEGTFQIVTVDGIVKVPVPSVTLSHASDTTTVYSVSKVFQSSYVTNYRTNA